MVSCCVPFCNSKRRGIRDSNKDEPRLSFHEFPVNQEKCEQWLKIISRRDFVPNTNSASSVVCSVHFKEDDYSNVGKYRRLKPQAVPSIFPGYPRYKVPVIKPPRRQIQKKALPPAKIRRAKTLDVPTEEVVVDREEPPVRSCDKANQTIESSVTHKSMKRVLNRLRVKTSRLTKAVETKQLKLNESLQKLERIESNKVYKALQQVQAAGETGDLRAKFLMEQLLNYVKKRPTWSGDVVGECVVLRYLSPSTYKHIQKRGILLLPREATLKRFVLSADTASDATPAITDNLTIEASTTILTTEDETASFNLQQNISDHCYSALI